MTKKILKLCARPVRGVWDWLFTPPPGTVSEPWMTHEEIMQSDEVKNFLKAGGAAEKLLEIVEYNNKHEARRHAALIKPCACRS